MAKLPTYINYDGFLMGKNFPRFESALKYKAQPGDIFISSYPKCGTTWMQNIIYLIFHNGEPLGIDRNISEFCQFLEHVGSDAIVKHPQPRVIKTHLPYEMTPQNPESKYIYIARNPKDVVVSFFHHTRGWVDYYDFEDGQFDDFFEIFIRGETDYGDYFDSLMSWARHMNDPNILFLTYEDLSNNIKKNIISIIEFLGGELSVLKDNESVINKIIEHSSFASMSQDQNRWHVTKGPSNFVRKGQVKDWKNYLSEDQSRRIDEKFNLRTKDTAIATLWKDIM